MRHTLSRFFGFLFTWLIIIFVVTSLMNAFLHKDIGPGSSLEDLQDDKRFPGLVKTLIQAHQHYVNKDYLAALVLLEDNEVNFKRHAGSDRDYMYQYYKLRGYCHIALWQYVESEKMWKQAEKYASRTRDKQHAREMLLVSTRAIEDVNHERHLKTTYHASPHVGPAAALQGRIVVIYVFLADGVIHDWSLRERSHVMRVWHSAQDWLAGKAKNYGSDVKFVHRMFVVNKHPVIKRLRVGDFNQNFRNADRVAMLAARHFGYKNILDFTESIRREEKADQAIIMFHLARDGRSFASRCMHRCNEFGEFVFLMEPTRPKRWQSLEYAQAHEALHLFGADDLYNIGPAKYFAVRDIMNYPSSQLNASTLEDLTAYAIGLHSKKPVAPFRVKLYSSRR